jgi:iron-sulfur cluster repair protein YtfE (RIC family)
METIRQAFCRDHAHHLTLIAAVVRDLSGADGADVGGALTVLARRVRSHLRIEEEVLFPAVERLVGDATYPVTSALRREHDVFRSMLGDIERGLAAGRLVALAGDLRELEAAIRIHTAKEEQVVYPMVDRLLSPATILEMAAILGESPPA